MLLSDLKPPDFLTVRPTPHNRDITQPIHLDETYYEDIISDIIYALEIFNTKQMTGLSPWDYLDNKKDLKVRDIHILAKMEAMRRDAENMKMNSMKNQQSSKKPTVRKFK